ncbi:MAG: SurA N-terminal domain-containing protein [Prevotellaceae bacterium]|nr:SurA N-terminal domain-containing protein [Candidatus Colivivens caballi]
MATLGKIRKHGVLLVTVIAVALFLFVAGDLFRGAEGLLQQRGQNVGEINGKSMNIQDYQALVDEYQTYYEVLNGTSSFSEDQLAQIKDEAWQNFVQNELIGKECEALGLTVTDNEVLDVIKSGASQMLQVPLFMNQQTGRYDYTQLQQFLNEYNQLKSDGQQIPEAYTKIYKYYMFAQKQIRTQYLTQKYQVLLSKLLMSNPVEAKMNFEARTNESDIILASFPYTANTDKFDVTDQEIKDRYNKDKEQYYQMIESRDIKYIDVAVTPDDADRAEAEKDMNEAYTELAAAANNTAAGNVCRQQTSSTQYTNLLKMKEAYPQFIASQLDSMEVGTTVKPQFDQMTGYFYTYRLLDKQTQADSVLYRQLAAAGKDEAASKATADSIVNALQSGAAFADIAKKYNQPSDSTWVATAQYQTMAPNADNELFIKTLFNMEAGSVKAVKLSNGMNVVLQVLDKKNPVTKYNVASIVKQLIFSENTYTAAYNKFSSFLAANNTIEKLEANAEKEGYVLQTLPDLTANQHMIAGVHNTREAIKWLFDEAKKGDVSELFKCGNSDHFLVAALTGVNEKGYRSIEKSTDIIKNQIINDKKAEKIIASLKGVKSVSEAQGKGAIIDSLNHVTFASPAFIRATNASEPVISASASKAAKNAFVGPVKGDNGVYVFQVANKSKINGKFDEKQEMATMSQMNLRAAFQPLVNSLYMKAEVKDLRYKFF